MDIYIIYIYILCVCVYISISIHFHHLIISQHQHPRAAPQFPGLFQAAGLLPTSPPPAVASAPASSPPGVACPRSPPRRPGPAVPTGAGPWLGDGWGMGGGWVGFGGKTWETCGKNIPWNGKMMSMSSIFLGHRKSMKVFTPEMATLVHYKTGKKPPWESLLAGAKFDFRGPPQFRVPGASVFSK